MTGQSSASVTAVFVLLCRHQPCMHLSISLQYISLGIFQKLKVPLEILAYAAAMSLNVASA